MVAGKGTGRVTLLDVAREAGVSRATASLVIRKSPLVGAETRRRVEEALERLGYVYNMGAASMRASRSNTMGVLIPNLSNPFFSEMLSGIERVLGAAGMVVVLAHSQESTEKQDAIIQRMRERGVDGLIVCPAARTSSRLLSRAADWGLPMVQALRYVSDSTGDYSGSDIVGGMGQAVDHLVGLGHERIIFVAAGPMHSARAERFAGFRAAMARHALDPEMTLESPLTPTGSPELAEQLVVHPGRPTAALCFTDTIAAGIANGLTDIGFKVGKDVSVMGFDDLAAAQLVRPRLTSVAAFPQVIGETAAELLLERLLAPERPARRIVNLMRLVARQSTGPAPTA